MTVDRPRWRWTFLSAIALVGAFLALVRSEKGWDAVGVFHLRPYFADLVAILAAGDAQRAGLDVYQPNPFDPFGRPHVYGPWWLVTGRLGLSAGDAWWLGAVLAVAFAGVALWLFAPRTPGAALLACLLLLSPPVLLGLERGNNDLVIFLLLAGAAALLARPAVWAGAGGAAVLVVASVLKFYPLVALAALLARKERPARTIVTVAGALVVFAVLWWLQRDGFFRALALAPRPDTFLAYGIRLFGLMWQRSGAELPWLLAGHAVGLGAACALLWRGRRALARAIPDEGLLAATAVAGASCWLFCYLANNNYPYRAVLLLLLVPAWLALGRGADPAARALGRGWLALLGLLLWSAAPRWWALGELENAGTRSALGRLLFLVGWEQTLVFVLSLSLAAALGAWGWRRWRTLTAHE